MVEKLFDYWETKKPVTLFCCMNNITIKLDDLLIEDIVTEGEKIKVYFNEDDFIKVDPSEYTHQESCDSKFIKSNGDYIAFIGEVEVC